MRARGWGMVTLIAGLLASGGAGASAQEKINCTVSHAVPSAADLALAGHDFARAEAMYSDALKAQPRDVASLAGLVRAELGQGKLDEALALVNGAVAAGSKSALTQDLTGEVALRRGEPELAVAAFDQALKLDPCDARAHWDAFRYMNLAGLFGSARKQLELAHSLAPDDPTIQRSWRAATAPPLSAEQRIARLKERMEAPDAAPEQKAGAAEAIRAIEARQRGDCEPVGVVTATTLKMASLNNGPTRPFYAGGLDVLMNGKRKRLEIDTGASGLLISRGSAVSAGLVPEAEVKISGIGDNGPAQTFVTHVDHLQIGGMEFKNCMVRVLEKRSALDVDGVIGMDVFRNYLVTLDMPMREVRLAPLPKRPDDVATPEGLATTGDLDDAPATEKARPNPKDRYIAPEMKDWSRVYRVGHQLILPTRIGKAPVKLFLMDTGASTLLISQRAAREVTQVYGDDRVHVRGFNGDVKNSALADSVTIQFAGVQQLVRGMVSIDLSGMSRSVGLEIAGVVGFPTLSQLVISIDYRDNLIHVLYDPNHGYGVH